MSPDLYSQMPRSVLDMIEKRDAPTAPLDDFLTAYKLDDNLWWRVGCGHHLNLFESLLDLLFDDQDLEWDADESLHALQGSMRPIEDVELPDA